MVLARALAMILAVTLGSMIIGCRTGAAPAPTAAPTPTIAPTPTAAAVISPTPTTVPPTVEPPTAPAPTVPLSNPGPSPAPSPSAPPPSPTPAGPSLTEVPVTDGPVRAVIMPSRDHFPSQLRISDVVPNGYSTVPPTSGQHWNAWSDCGFYNYPLPDELLVHNLEHGNIIVSYNLNDESDVSALRDAVAAIPLAEEYAIVRRYHGIPEGMVALTTWGVLDRMLGVDPDRIAGFFRDFPGNTGPEFPNGLPCTTGIQMTDSSGG